MKLSVVIPAWREAPQIGAVVKRCLALADEVIVADAHSPDDTASMAAAAGAIVVHSKKGRGAQLNVGARRATGDVVLFVHADSVLPIAARAAIEAALADPATMGGNFRLRFVPDAPASRLFAAGNHARRKLFRMYYGDSCIFVRRAVFDQLGGYRELAVFEDHDFVRRLEQSGRTHYEEGVCVESSARRFQGRAVQTLAIWTLMQALHAAGVSPERLSRLYSDIR